MNERIVFFDTEVGRDSKKIMDIGAVSSDGAVYHKAQVNGLLAFLSGADYICGHNIIHFDLPIIDDSWFQNISIPVIDTLYLSPLLFPRRPYHSLIKDEKLVTQELNNPVSDSKKAQKLFMDEVNAYWALSERLRLIYGELLYAIPEFTGFFKYVHFPFGYNNLECLIKDEFKNKICSNVRIKEFINSNPVELAYALALISTGDRQSVTPRWLQMNYPKIENVIKNLCNTPCKSGCEYCREKLDIHKTLKRTFGYDDFRKYDGESLQEEAVRAAVNGKSLLAIFPTGGGKSITFQLPAIMAGDSVHGLTIVISPLQSLMKDQVDNLVEAGITGAVTVNGLLSPVERADAFERIENGSAELLYISPEMLRSSTVERMLLSRNIVRFVIDEAHCFSSWGQDFRVDYLYIGDFIKMLQAKKNLSVPIPVSCFTATAKQKVVTDICEYFERKLGLKLELFVSSASRKNLHYTVLYKDTEDEKYITLRNIIESKECPTIVYVSRTKKTRELADKLTNDGFTALPYNGKMESNEKIANQEAFINNEVKIIVATSAFGMGVDKKDVKLVIHYDISDSLENYVQEAGRAGREPSIQAECYILFNNNDLDKHFMLLNQTKLSIGEIQQVWKAIKELTRTRSRVCCSALEIARQAGWDDSVNDIETRAKTAIAALDNAGYISRGKNVPHVYATSILAKDMTEASDKILAMQCFSESEEAKARTIVSALISSRTIASNNGSDAESRVDYLADRIGIEKLEVINIINKLRQNGLLSDDQDMSAYILKTDSEKQINNTLERYSKLEQFIFNYIVKKGNDINLKELNEAALNQRIVGSSVKNIRTVLYFLSIKNYLKKKEDKEKNNVKIELLLDNDKIEEKYQRRILLSKFIANHLWKKASKITNERKNEILVNFSLVGIYNAYNEQPHLDLYGKATLQDVEDALLYLSKIGALRLEGGFLVIYNGLEIKRKELDNKIRYKIEDYRLLDEFYKQKIQQIHIIGEYANMMVKDYNGALEFVHDYFQMDYKKFIAKYFKGEREAQITRNITPDKFQQLFGELSNKQSEIIHDSESKYIVVAAGPGSGKTKLLVHKLASLLLLEDVKHEQLLMLTFSRASATEFKQRLIQLIGNAAHLVDIKTFHSYCFDLLGKIGNLESSKNVVRDAANMIYNGEVERGKITKNVLVIDEAQDMDSDEFKLVCALMSMNDDMRVIAVGDDDQNIFEFRGSDSNNMRLLISEHGAKYYQMIDNYRSEKDIVCLGNSIVKTIKRRMKNTEIKSVSQENGNVKLIYHRCNNFEQSVVDDIALSDLKGKICVLTNTNDEALRITGLLTKEGIRAKLIQTNDEFKLYNLIEIRAFIRDIDEYCKTSIISDEVWKNAKNNLEEKFKSSKCLPNCLNLIDTFGTINSKTKYRMDFYEFVNESNYDDFYGDDKETVYVSTIHKSKGREFDSVYLYLSNVSIKDDKDKRKIYVGITRAKSNLFVYHNLTMLQSYKNFTCIENFNKYEMPEQITIQMTHRDVVLDFFKNKKELITNLRSGYQLEFDGTYFYYDNKKVTKISQKKINEIAALKVKGYQPISACIRFIVAWKGENDETECAVLLPDLIFAKM